MPIRTASLSKQLHKNGTRLHQAMMARLQFEGADHPASKREEALLAERQFLKEARERREAMALQPKVKPERVHKESKAPKEKAPKAAKEAKAKPATEVKGKAKEHVTRTEKAARKKEAIDAAKRAARKTTAGKPGAKASK
jgi:hypothetical protein